MEDFDDAVAIDPVEVMDNNYLKATPMVSSTGQDFWFESTTTHLPSSNGGQWSLYVSVSVSLAIIGVVLCCVSVLLRRFGSRKPVEMNPPLEDDNRPPSYEDFLENPSLFQPTNRSCHSMMRLSSSSSSNSNGSATSANRIPPSYESLFGEVERQESLKANRMGRQPQQTTTVPTPHDNRLLRLISWPQLLAPQNRTPRRTSSCLVSIPDRYNYEPELKRFRKLRSYRRTQQIETNRLSV